MTYQEQLKDPRWQRKRLEVLTRADWTCERCKEKTKTLHVHHQYYISKRLPWEYPPFCFQCLCVDCHERATNAPEVARSMGITPFWGWEIGVDHFGEEIYEMAHSDAWNEKHKEIVHALHAEPETP